MIKVVADVVSRLTDAERQGRAGILCDHIAPMRRYAEELATRGCSRKASPCGSIAAPRFDKYSLWFRWSPRAFERLTEYTKGGRRPAIKGLRLEHVIPRGILAEELLANDPGDLAAFLDKHFQAAVITTDDDAQLNQHGVRHRMPEGWALGFDPWVRYEQAGFRPRDFLVPCVVRPELA